MLEALRPCLRHLDGVLAAAVEKARAARPGMVSDAFRGLYIDDSEVQRLLEREPGEPTLWTDAALHNSEEQDGSRIGWLMHACQLSGFDLDVLLIALAPEIDLRYERLYAFLQDDVTRRRPNVDLVLNLLCASAEERIARRDHFSPHGALLRNDMVRLVADPSHVEPPLPAHFLKVDEQILAFLLESEGIDARLAPFCRYVEPEPSSTHAELRALARAASSSVHGLRVYLQGPDSLQKQAAAEAVAAELGASLLVADLTGAPDGIAKLAVRDAWLRGAVLYVEGIDNVPDANAQAVILGGTQPSVWAGAVTVRLEALDCRERKQCWRDQLERAGIEVPAQELEAVSSRFVLSGRQIRDAARSVRQHAVWREGPGAGPEISDLFAAARAQCGGVLRMLARKVDPRRRWEDIVLPEDLLAQLHELCRRAALGHRVLQEWGFDRTLSLGKGVNALFAGPSGTGKTLAAEVVATELQLDLYKIDLSGVVSKYIGETEKNLDRIFTAAQNANAILFFDEADALFGKRSEVRDSHDRYANIEIAYLLQKMEEYEGVAILATNLRQNLDESFTRRLTFSLHFPYPDDASRLRIWKGIWPTEVPLDRDVDLAYLARRFKLSGGGIRNVALAAAFLAAEGGTGVRMDHLLHATRREYQKLGKQLSPADLLEAAS